MIKKASERLHKKLQGRIGYGCVGEAGNKLIVYGNKHTFDKKYMPKQIDGFPIEFKHMDDLVVL